MDEIFNRGTCRYFKELTPVPDEELLTLVKAGMQARAVGNQKSRDFIIVTREDNKDAENVKEFIQSYQSPEVAKAAETLFNGGAVPGW